MDIRKSNPNPAPNKQSCSEVLKIEHHSLRTEEAYVYWILCTSADDKATIWH